MVGRKRIRLSGKVFNERYWKHRFYVLTTADDCIINRRYRTGRNRKLEIDEYDYFGFEANERNSFGEVTCDPSDWNGKGYYFVRDDQLKGHLYNWYPREEVFIRDAFIPPTALVRRLQCAFKCDDIYLSERRPFALEEFFSLPKILKIIEHLPLIACNVRIRSNEFCDLLCNTTTSLTPLRMIYNQQTYTRCSNVLQNCSPGNIAWINPDRITADQEKQLIRTMIREGKVRGYAYIPKRSRDDKEFCRELLELNIDVFEYMTKQEQTNEICAYVQDHLVVNKKSMDWFMRSRKNPSYQLNDLTLVGEIVTKN